jgi:dihydrofolate reductase
MGILRFDMNMSLDGYVEDASGRFDWSDPDDEVHRLANERTAEASALLFGRRLYEVMEDFWSAPERADGEPVEAEFAAIYVARPRIVFSDTLDEVADGCRLVRRADAVAEVERLKAEHDGVLALGGPGLAASLLDLVDEFNLFVVPTVVGGGKPVFPPGRRLDLTLVEHRTTASGWTMLRYRRAR